MRVLPSYNVYTDDDESMVVVTRVSMNASERKAALRDRYTFVDDAIERGIVQPSGCLCSHCLNDWDCCGRMVPSYVTVRPVAKGIKLEQSYFRNI